MLPALIILVPAALLAGVLARAATKPNTFRLERSTRVSAPPEKVFPFLDDFHNWAEWSPWERLDPALKRSYSGAEKGVGAVYEWTGNNKVGTGRMEILESMPERVVVKLQFIKPWQATNTTEFTLRPADGGTNVVWAMYGPDPFMFRVMKTIMDMEKAIAKDFDNGLANLKAAAER